MQCQEAKGWKEKEMRQKRKEMRQKRKETNTKQYEPRQAKSLRKMELISRPLAVSGEAEPLHRRTARRVGDL